MVRTSLSDESSVSAVDPFAGRSGADRILSNLRADYRGRADAVMRYRSMANDKGTSDNGVVMTPLTLAPVLAAG